MKDGKTNREYLNFRRRFLIVSFLFMTIVVSLLLATYGSRWRFYYNARITDFSTCLGLDANGNPIPVTYPITVVAKEISACGYLEGIGPTIPLVFYLQCNEDSVIKTLTGYYKVGYITAHFVAPLEGFQAGSYQVLVYQGRSRLASIEFIVEEP